MKTKWNEQKKNFKHKNQEKKAIDKHTKKNLKIEKSSLKKAKKLSQ